MPNIDYDVMIRDRAYEIWERAGRPVGLEHEHWAEARSEVEREMAAKETTLIEVEPVAAPSPARTAASEPAEATRMREALYCPEPFSFELFGKECPAVDSPIVLRSNNRTQKRPVREAA